MGMLVLNVKVFPMPLSKQPALLIDVIKRPSIFVQECHICFVFFPWVFYLFIYIFCPPNHYRNVQRVSLPSSENLMLLFSVSSRTSWLILTFHKFIKAIIQNLKIKKKSDLKAFHMIKLMSSKSYLF